jgi:hypothetical protein
LAYEPFTNAIGVNILGSAGGFGFNGVWQTNSSAGIATNIGFGLSYTDAASNSLVTIGNAAFFQGSTSASSAMQPIRLFNFARGTNGTDGGTTWISFLVFRTGPIGTLPGNPYGRGANVPHDINNGALQKLAVGNSSGATSNTVGLIPQGSGTYLKGATNTFGGVTNFVVLRIDHVAGANNDNAYLFVNPMLATEPSISSAGAISTNGFDFSFDRLRIFAGGQSSEPYAEMIVDEYRIGETFADVAPIVTSTNPPIATGPIIITNATLVSGSTVLSGIGGSNGGTYFVLAGTNLLSPVTNWVSVATNTFDVNGNFVSTNPPMPNAVQQFFRLFIGSFPAPPATAPTIITDPTNQIVLAGSNVNLVAAASGTSPVRYQWYFNTNTALAAATNSSLFIPNAQATNAGSYFAIVTNSAGSATSAVATLTVNAPPIITAQPTNQTVTLGGSAAFTVVATGTGTLRYEWYFNNTTLLAGATNSSLAITNAQTTNGGGYSAVITNNFGSVTSAVAILTLSEPLNPGAYFVSPTGNDSNLGTLASPFLTITKGLNTITTVGTVYLRGGTYPQPAKLTLSRIGTTNAAIKLWAYPGETPTINSAGNSSDGFSISGRNYHLRGLTVINAGHNGINISGHSNVVENCVVRSNGNTGLHITGGSGGTTFPSFNLILNCDAYLNYDPPIGGNADGFSAKWDLGSGNVFRGCRAWWNSDDGWDLWMGNGSVLIEDCWAFYNGTNYWADPQFDGNGQGFKLGGNYIGSPHRLLRSLAFKNESNGVDQNNNLAGQTIDNNTGWANKARNFNLNHGTNVTPHIVRNNLSFAGASGDSFRSGTLFTSNSWQVVTSPAANASDVLSVGESSATAPRNADGSLPSSPFLRPVPGGRLIDKGANIGEPFTGASPDLGAFENGL